MEGDVTARKPDAGQGTAISLEAGMLLVHHTLGAGADPCLQLDFLLREWRVIRRAGAELDEVSNVFNAYWAYIREGM